MPVPAGLDDITPDWLTEALREGGELPRGTVRAVSVDTIGADRGLTGVIAQVRPTYRNVDTGPPPPSSLVAKLPIAERAVASTYRTAQARDAAAARRYYQRCARWISCYEACGWRCSYRWWAGSTGWPTPTRIGCPAGNGV